MGLVGLEGLGFNKSRGWVSFVNLTYGLETGKEFGKF
jgi:hypothetical protein